MSWLMTNDMRVIVERSALSILTGCSVSESYFKTKGSDGIQIEWRVFFFFLALWDGGWSSGFDCVLSHCSSLTDIWKVPLGKYSGLLGLNTEFLDWKCQLAAASQNYYSVHCIQLSKGNVCLYIHGCICHAWGMWTIDMALRQGSNQRLSARSTSVQVMSEEKEQAFF